MNEKASIELKSFCKVDCQSDWAWFADTNVIRKTYCGRIVNEIGELLNMTRLYGVSIIVVDPKFAEVPILDANIDVTLRNWYRSCSAAIVHCEAVLFKYNDRVFPVDIRKFVGLPLNSHPGAFGCVRKFNVHEGIDLYGSPKDPVFAIDSGVVVNVGPFTGPEVNCPWWLPTSAVTVKSNNEYFVYGELSPTVKKLDNVRAGDKIGELMPVLPASKRRSDIPGHSVTMLHLEKYNLNTYDEHMEWQSWVDKSRRPVYLEDPTKDLLEILSKFDAKSKYLVM